MKIRRWIFRKLLKWCGLDKRIKMWDHYQHRWDEMSLVDFVIVNHDQQQTFDIVTEKGERTYAQPAHYIKYEMYM